MITIGITFCDNDYLNYGRMVRQIKERVHVDYELIIIDNTTGNKLDQYATYAFGYNAYQFAARYKIISLSQGDYIWFVDGDDEVISLNEIPSDADIISYNIWSESLVTDQFDERCENNIHNWMFLDKRMQVPLWNKLIKRSLYADIDNYITDPLLKVVSLEDVFYLALALKNAKSVELRHEYIYRHYRGLSTALAITPQQFDELVIGYSDIIQLFKKLDYIDVDELKRGHFTYFSRYMAVCDDPMYIVTKLMNLFPDYKYWKEHYEEYVSKVHNVQDYNTLRSTFIERFGKNSIPTRWCKNISEDGHESVEFFEPQMPVLYKWPHILSIICLVYDGNVKYLRPFTEQLRKRVHIKYETIIVDNRDDKSVPLDYACGQVVTLDHNVGILDGRRAGFETSHNEYIWFVDIDDQPLHVYGDMDAEGDIISFPSGYEEEGILWYRWYHRDVLKKAYADIPHFFCIYYEDCLLHKTALKYGKETIIYNSPIYVHSQNEDSVTSRYISTTEDVDRLFIGWNDVQQYMSTHFEREEYMDSECCSFYLALLLRTSADVRPYFINKIYELFGEELVELNMKCAEERKYWYERARRYLDDCTRAL